MNQIGSCGTCKFGELVKDGDNIQGVECRRYPGQVMLLPASATLENPNAQGLVLRTVRPINETTFRCGEYAATGN